MADLWDWDGDDESAVEELLAQARDHSVLDQISAINCSSSDLDSRFRRLKSIPPPPPTSTTPPQEKVMPNKPVEVQMRAGSDSSLELEPESPSPPRKTGCFWCSPKKPSSRKRGKEFVAGILSEKAQRRLMKRAMKEEDKINREVEKIVNLASFRI